METASKAPAFEASEENLQIMYDLVDNEISYGNVRRPKCGSDAVVERPKPGDPVAAKSAPSALRG